MTSITLSSLHIRLRNKNRTLVEPLTITIPGGSLFGILGGSGSGKTSLLNVIASRYDPKVFDVPTDCVQFDSDNGSRSPDSVGLGYVTQSDHTLPHLTVRETLTYASQLKLPASVDRSAIVEAIILDLGLKECADSRIGDPAGSTVGGKRGISGGERRRVSVGLQILSSPEVLCCDECTSGLDSFTAVNVMETIKALTTGVRKTTVVCSIHQPRADIFSLLDYCLLLSKGGQAIYCGKVSEIVSYFSKLGYACPLTSNPADFFVDLSSIDPREPAARKSSTERVRRLERAYREHGADIVDVDVKVDVKVDVNVNAATTVRYSAPWLTQVSTLTSRMLRNTLRDQSSTLGGIFQALILGLVIMAIFWQLDESPAAVRSRFGCNYIAISAEPYIWLIICVERLCREMRVFDRELQDGLYSPSAYLLAYVIANTPQLLVQPLFFALPIYYGSNLRRDDGGIHVFIFIALCILLAFLIQGLAWSCVALERNFSVSSLIANSQFTFICLTSGFLVNSVDIPVYVSWVKKISFLHYSYRLLISNEFSRNSFTSCVGGGSNACVTIQGSDILMSQNVSVDDYLEPWCALFAMAVGYHLVALLLLNLIKVPPSASVAGEGGGAEEDEGEDVGNEGKEGNEGEDVGKEGNEGEDDGTDVGGMEMVAVTDQPTVEEGGQVTYKPLSTTSTVEGGDPPPVTVYVRSLTVAVNLPNGVTKPILDDVNACMRPGRLCALMGGSGSGKTSLLDLIARRVKFSAPISNDASTSLETSPSLFSRAAATVGLAHSSYRGAGVVSFNNENHSDAQVREIVGYVQQNDYHLPSLTVRETLLFHATLQLDPSTSVHDKQARVDKILTVLGLKGCSETRVGGEEVKGVSGGEKRRLSVGVQLLLDPSIALLDEVTTGLDSWSALSVVETLKSLCRRGAGRTVILSIHAPRYDVFDLMDDVVLLSRGRVVWSGSSADMLKHLAAIGQPCPSLTNPADHVLDVSSVDLRSPALEEESRKRVAVLVEAFKEWTRRTGAVVASSATTSAPTPTLTPTPTPTLTPTSAIALLPEKPLSFTLPLLLGRSLLNQQRNPILMSTRVSQGLFFALILCCFFAPLGSGQSAIQSRIGLLYMTTSLTFIGMLNNVAVFPLERNVFLREYVDGSYNTTAFLAVYYILAIPFVALSAAMLSVLLTYAIGLNQTGYAFVVFAFVQFCFMLCGEAIGVAFLSIFRTVGFSINVVSVFISVFSMSSGFISIHQSGVVNALNNLSPVWWGSWVLTNIAFRDTTFTCTAAEVQANACLPTGEKVLDLYSMLDTNGPHGDMGIHLLVLGMLTLCLIGISWIFLRARAFIVSH